VYQIYPRSFADSDGDGIGDLRGIISRIPYLAALGIDAVWLSPFYPSALADGGYDVDDYRDVDPRLGTLADFSDLAAGLHAVGIKVIVDIVPNHTSNRHPWFVEALAAGRGSAARDRYIFRDGRGPGGSQPPSDWRSAFGGPAWTRVPDGQWYLHLFATEQPDLNWASREVRDDFLATLRFWSDRGADGFRVDVAHGLAKDLGEPLAGQQHLTAGAFAPGSHPLWDRDEVHEIYAEWRGVFNEYDPPRTAVAEAWVHHARRPRYASPAGLGQAFNFDLLQADWDAARFREIIADNLAGARLEGSSSTWVLSNHDVVRHASRYGLPAGGALNSDGMPYQDGKAWLLTDGAAPELERDLGLRRARAATLLMLALPGSAYLYQGEELGLQEVPDIPARLIQDPAFRRSGGAEKGRDGCRVPLPWAPEGTSFGFGTGSSHLPQPAWFGPLSVEVQDADPGSTLNLYREALSWRRRLRLPATADAIPATGNPTTSDPTAGNPAAGNPAAGNPAAGNPATGAAPPAPHGPPPDLLSAAPELAWVDAGPDVVRFRRPGGWECATNFGTRPVPLPPGRVVVASAAVSDGQLPPDTTAWLLQPGR